MLIHVLQVCGVGGMHLAYRSCQQDVHYGTSHYMHPLRSITLIITVTERVPKTCVSPCAFAVTDDMADNVSDPEGEEAVGVLLEAGVGELADDDDGLSLTHTLGLPDLMSFENDLHTSQRGQGVHDYPQGQPYRVSMPSRK